MEAATALGVAAGLPAPAVPFLLATLSLPLVGFAHSRLLRGAGARNAASLALGLALSSTVYDWASTSQLLYPTAAAYVLMAVSRRHAGPLVFVVTFAYLIHCHVVSASGLAWKEGRIDYTGTLMVATLKLISVAFDYSDGARGRELSAVQAASALSALPSPLAFLGYVFYPCTLLAGPWVPFRDFDDFTRRRGVWAPGAPRPSSALGPTLQCAVLGLACAGAHAALTPLVPDSAFLSPAWLARTGWPQRLAYMWAMGLAARCKYYFVWKWAEAACNAAGLGWGGVAWDRARNIDVLGVELASSAAAYPVNWNARTGLWLRYYCYERLCPPAAAEGGARARPLTTPFVALLATQTVSGLWHGIFAGYWCFFVSSAFMLHASKVVFRYQRALAPAPSLAWRLSSVLHGLLSAFHLAYLAAPFIIITWPGSLAAWRSVRFSGHVSMVGICLLGALLPAGRDRGRERGREKKKA